MSTETEARAAAANGEIENPLNRLTDEQIEALGREFDAIHDEVFSDLGERDAKYIRSMIEMHRRLVLLGRAILVPSRFWPAWILGTGALGSAKILENMEIGHNVMHGQWDWMNNPEIHSSTWDWDTASTKEAWKHSHNYIHHTYTNIRGKDKDLGYEIMRIDPHQKWHPVYLFQPLYNLALMALFEWGVAVHDMDIEAIRAGEKPKEDIVKDLKGIAGKARTQIVKDYIAWPALSALAAAAATTAVELVRGRGEPRPASRREGLRRRLDPRRRTKRALAEQLGRRALDTGVRTYKATFWADIAANVVRNLWSHAIIFCGHFPDQTYTFNQDEVEDETRGAWYVRQLAGAANIEGGPMFHVWSGNLGYQVEHHLFPDIPSTRYAEIAPRVKEICERYELPYNTGPFFQQWGMVNRTILRLAFPGGKPRPKPGPYKGGDGAAAASANGRSRRPEERPTGANGSGPEQADEGVRVEMPEED
ncbi:MAG TPA: acyl-CoA desaturase [Solirubrobacterales bacterium]